MASRTVTLAEAITHLSQLTDLAAQGGTVIITKHGKPVAQVSRTTETRKPIVFQALRALTDAMPLCKTGSGKLLRQKRSATKHRSNTQCTDTGGPTCC
jgi:antitoxin (DNA-binding transcriptional repressor) of toxin-antitoxin stability system